MSHVHKAVEEERYRDAVFMRDCAGTGLKSLYRCSTLKEESHLSAPSMTTDKMYLRTKRIGEELHWKLRVDAGGVRKRGKLACLVGQIEGKLIAVLNMILITAILGLMYKT